MTRSLLLYACPSGLLLPGCGGSNTAAGGPSLRLSQTRLPFTGGAPPVPDFGG